MLTHEEACLWEKHSRQRKEKEPCPWGSVVSDMFKAQQDKGWVRKQSEGKRDERGEEGFCGRA